MMRVQGSILVGVTREILQILPLFVPIWRTARRWDDILKHLAESRNQGELYR